MNALHAHFGRQHQLTALAGLVAAICTGAASAQPYANYYGRPNQSETLMAVEQVPPLTNRGAVAIGDYRAVGQAPRSPTIFTADYDWYIADVWDSGERVADAELRNPGLAEASSIEILPDGSSVIAGIRGVLFPLNDIGVARVSLTGALQWAVDLPGTGGFFDGVQVALISGNRVVVSGRDADIGGPLLYVLSTNGALISAVRVNSASPTYRLDTINDIKWDSATGTLVLCGNMFNNSLDAYAVYVARIDVGNFASSARAVYRYDSQNFPMYVEATGIEVVGNGQTVVYGRTTLEDPKNPGFGTEGLWLFGLTSTLTPTWSNITTLAFNNGLQAVQAGVRLHPELGQLGVVANYTFGDGGSNIVLSRYLPDGTFLGLNNYPLDGYTYGRGITTARFTAQPGWVLAGSAQHNTGGPDGLLVRTRADGSIGCQETLEVVNNPAPYNSAAFQLSFSPLPVQSTWSTFLTYPNRPWAVGCTPMSAACNPADICGVGATYDSGTGTVDVPPDGQLTIEDFLVFLSAFGDGTGCPGGIPCNPADICGVGATYSGGVVDVGPDGQLTIEDFLIFLSAFGDGAGCP